jgi:hypothetical protein
VNITAGNHPGFQGLAAALSLLGLTALIGCGGAAVTTRTTVTTTITRTIAALADDDQAAIYTAVIRQYYYHDYQQIGHTGYLAQPTVIYIAAHYGDSTGHPMENQNSGPIPEDMQIKLTNLLGDLPVPVSWVKSGWASVTLGKILPQPDGPAELAVVYVYGNVDVSGRIYTMEQIDGIWQVVSDWEVFSAGP